MTREFKRKLINEECKTDIRYKQYSGLSNSEKEYFVN